ncbi:MAG: HepT-like ribonuclease domain-containing protein [bacterium]
MTEEINKYLYDIYQAVKNIKSFVKNKSFENYKRNTLLQSALERQFEIIGEALNRIKKIDDAFISSIDDAHKIIGLRNVIAHGYDIIDLKIIWDAVKYNLPKLKKEITRLLKK